MTVAALPSVVSYVEDGTTVSFPVPYRFQSAGLIVERILNGAAIPLSAGVDYSVTGGDTDQGGTLTRSVATNGAILRIRRSTPLAQEMSYTTGDRFPATSHEAALDQQTMGLQDLHRDAGEGLARALQLPIGEVASALPPAAARRDTVLGFDPVTGERTLLPTGSFPPGPPGGAGNVVKSIGQLRTALTSSGTMIAAYDASGSPMTWTVGDFADLAIKHPEDYIEAAGVPLSQGAWVRYGATAMRFDGRTVDAKLRETVSVTDARFAGGAKGNGIANDAAAVQAAIDFTGAQGGGYVLFPAGLTFLLDTQIMLRDNVYLTGYGSKIVVGRSFAGPNRPLFKNFTGAGFAEQSVRTASRNLGFFGLEIDGKDWGIPGELIPQDQMHGVMICVGTWYDDSGIDGMIVRDCHFHNMAGAGVMAWKSSGITIDGSRFRNFFANVSLSLGSGIDFHEVNRSTVTNTKITHTAAGKSWHGMVLLDWDAGCFELVVTHNVIIGMNEGDGISCEGNNLNNLTNSLIANNVIRNCLGQGIGADRCVSVSILSNVIVGVVGPGILCTETDDIVIANNSITLSGLGGIFSASGTQRYTITGNRVSSISYYDSNYRGEGITVIDSAYAPNKQGLIADNVVRDTAGAGIYCLNYGSVISGNSVYNAGTSSSLAPMLRAGIVANAPNVVTNNLVRSLGQTAYAISSAAGDFPSIEANRFDGTFTGALFYIAYRGTALYLNLSVDIDHASYDARSNIFRGYTAGPPGGVWFANDDFDERAPTAGQPWGYRCVATGAGNFKPKGSLAA